MTTNKERIENLEAGLVGIQGGFQRMELDVGNKLHQLEEAISKLSDILRANKGPVDNTSQFQEMGSRPIMEEGDCSRQIVPSQLAKLVFPKYAGDDPTEWFNRVAQFFEYQGTTEAQKVSMASFNL